MICDKSKQVEINRFVANPIALSEAAMQIQTTSRQCSERVHRSHGIDRCQHRQRRASTLVTRLRSSMGQRLDNCVPTFRSPDNTNANIDNIWNLYIPNHKSLTHRIPQMICDKSKQLEIIRSRNPCIPEVDKSSTLAIPESINTGHSMSKCSK